MRVSTLVACLLAAGCTDDPSLDSASHAIVSGTPDSADPATVFLWLGGGSCSGTLVSPKTVLTARHCLAETTASQVQVFFGNDSNATGTWIDAVRLQSHPTTDIGMIALAEAGPTPWIPLNSTALTGHEGDPVRIVGFGVTGENERDAGYKRQGMTALYGLEDDVMLIGNAGSKTCYGDSGGPAFMMFGGVETVAGVTSFGTDVCEAGLSGEIRVDPYVDWIRTFIDTEDPGGLDPPPDPGTDPGTDPAPDPGGQDPLDPTDPDQGGGGGTEPPPTASGDLTGGCAMVSIANGGAGLLAPLLMAGLAWLIRRSNRPARRGSSLRAWPRRRRGASARRD